ncbi:MAG TPA: Uma2 family endonuclease, partial [Gemmatimonadaceae bacterium]|nr:Uma2 family endonuclease [Gemmatimonadaceae bacterium]
AQTARDWTVADLEELPDDGRRYEVIDGELLVTPAPSLDHQEAIARLYVMLAPYVAAQGCGHVVFAPADVVFSPRRGVQPDLFVVPLVDGRRPKRFADAGRLLLAVEVLSPSTARADRLKKRNMYRAERVDEYWVVDLDARLFERTTPADDRVEIVADRLEWRPEGTAAPLVIDVERYFTEVLGAA